MFFLVRRRWALKILENIRESTATGSDLLPAFLLRALADVLASPFTMLVRRIIMDSCWPDIWKNHWLCPIFKRGLKHMPSNYWAVHLTSILSKAAERLLAFPFVFVCMSALALIPGLNGKLLPGTNKSW